MVPPEMKARAAIGISGALIAGLLAGGTPAAEPAPEAAASTAESAGIVFPPPPDQPRIRFLHSLSRLEDVKRDDTWLQRIYKFLTGTQELEGKALARPYGVTAKDDRVYVADSQGALVIFDRPRERIRSLGGTVQGRLVSAIGVAVDDDGNIYVTDSVLNLIKVYDERGNFRRNFGTSVKFSRPTGIVYDSPRRRILVADTGGGRILGFSLSGDLILEFGEKGLEEHNIGMPVNIAVDAEGRILVGDPLRARVQTFSADGKFISAFGKRGDTPGNFARPRGIATDSDGNIYVVDALFRAVQIFDSEWRLLMYFGGPGTGPAGFLLPAGICIDDRDRIYVVDSHNRRVQVFQYLKDQAEIGAEREREKAGIAGRMEIPVTADPKTLGAEYAAGEWNLVIADRAGKTVRSFAGTGLPPKTLAWDGTDEKGWPVIFAPGTKVKLGLKRKGGPVEETTRLLGAVNVEPRLRMAEGGGIYSEVVLALPEGSFACWQCQIVDGDRVVAGWQGEGRPPERIRWSGLDENGVPVALQSAVCAWQFQDESGAWSIGERAVPRVEAKVEKGADVDRVRLIGAGFSGADTGLGVNHRFLLEKAAKLLRRHPGNILRVESYAATGAGKEADAATAASRANSVTDSLIRDFGIASSRVVVVSHGSDRPAPEYPGLDPERARQRVDLVLELKK